MKAYRVHDLQAGSFYSAIITRAVDIEAKSPIEAVRKYVKQFGSFTVKRNYQGRGRCFVNRKGYDVIPKQVLTSIKNRYINSCQEERS